MGGKFSQKYKFEPWLRHDACATFSGLEKLRLPDDDRARLGPQNLWDEPDFFEAQILSYKCEKNLDLQVSWSGIAMKELQSISNTSLLVISEDVRTVLSAHGLGSIN